MAYVVAVFGGGVVMFVAGVCEMARGELIARIETLGRRAPSMPAKRCPETGKRCYITREHAEAVHARMVESCPGHTQPARAYKCDMCHDWHLTRG